MNEFTGEVAGAGEGIISGSCITRGCGAGAMFRAYGLSVCACVSVLYLCKILGTVRRVQVSLYQWNVGR